MAIIERGCLWEKRKHQCINLLLVIPTHAEYKGWCAFGREATGKAGIMTNPAAAPTFERIAA